MSNHRILIAPLLLVTVSQVSAGPNRLAIAWNGASHGFVRIRSAEAPWSYEPNTATTNKDVVLRFAFGKLYAVSYSSGTVEVIDPVTMTVERTYSPGAMSRPLDIAVVSPQQAYVTREAATHLLRLDLVTGGTSEPIDFSFLADADGVPDLGTMLLFEGRLYVQVRRLNINEPEYFLRPAYLAVMDVDGESLIDADPVEPGVQGIELQGAAPQFKMQVVRESRRLFVSAAYGSHSAGGIEMIDLDAMQSLGLVVGEVELDPPFICCDLGPFVMTGPNRGYFVVSTDSTLSAHLNVFTVAGGVVDAPALHNAYNYIVPSMVHDPATDHVFLPTIVDLVPGVDVFRGATGEQLTTGPLVSPSQPTDIALLCDCPTCESELSCQPIPALSGWGLITLALLTLTAGSLRATRVAGP